MRIHEAIAYARTLLTRITAENAESYQATLTVAQLLGDVLGRKSDLYRRTVNAESGIAQTTVAKAALNAFVDMYDAGLISEASVQRRAQADVISDILDQARLLLASNDYHPAAAAVLIGSALEQFLRAWAEEKELDAQRKTIDAYAGALRGADLIDKQDKKDIDAWAGLRNSAAHGQFDDVTRDRISVMLDGVNLFLRKHDAGAPITK